MQFEDPKSILEAAAAKPSRDLDAPALMKKARGLRRARLTAAAAGLAVVVAAATASFGLIAEEGDAGPGPIGGPSADCDEDDRKCLAELTCWNPPPLEVSIFLHDDAAPDEVAELRAEILADPEVGEVVHFSKKEAFDEFRKIYADQPELWETIPPDALPASLRISASTVEAVDRIHGIKSPIVDEIHSGLEFRRRLCDDDALPAPAETVSPVGHGPVRVEMLRAECGTSAAQPFGRAMAPNDSSKWCRFVLSVDNVGDDPLAPDPAAQMLWATNGNAFTLWEKATAGGFDARLFGSPLAPGESTLGQVVFLLGPEAVPASLELGLAPGYAPQTFSLEYDCATDLREEPRGRCFIAPQTATRQSVETEGPVRVTLHACGVEPVEFADRKWIVVDPPFDATNVPRGFSGGGRMEVTTEDEARYVDASGIALHFRPARPGETRRCP